MSVLFNPLKIRDIKFKNRIFVSPMCQYSSNDGMPNEWHLVHLGSRAIGGAAMVMTEATAVSPEGRISLADAGIWNDKQSDKYKQITTFIKDHGAVPGIQLGHAGRKASTRIPWEGRGPLAESQGGWTTIAPSSVPFDDGYPVPQEMSDDDIKAVNTQFKEASIRAADSGFEVIELHMAHGYLLHEFLSPLSNKRKDGYGGNFESRLRFPLDVAETVRKAIPDDMPLFVRISVTDWAEEGWDLSQSIEFSRKLKSIGVDLIDCSSGGLIPGAKIPAGPNYQIPFSEAVKKNVGILTGGVGMITEAEQAEKIIAEGKADTVFLARQMLRDPYWPLHAAQILNTEVDWPEQYLRAKPQINFK